MFFLNSPIRSFYRSFWRKSNQEALNQFFHVKNADKPVNTYPQHLSTFVTATNSKPNLVNAFRNHKYALSEKFMHGTHLFSRGSSSAMFSVSNTIIPRLKVLDDMTAIAREMPIDFTKTVIFAVQHHLETTASLYAALQNIGIKRIYSIGKYYSTSPVIEDAMEAMGIKIFKSENPTQPGYFYEIMRKGIQNAWIKMLQEIEREDIETIIILDDGGRGLELMPHQVAHKYKVVGVEQTQAGLYSEALKISRIPIIQVASSALKKTLEPPLIATATIQAIKQLTTIPLFNAKLGLHNTVVGVVGFGAVGKALTKYLLSKNFYVIVYDSEEAAFIESDAMPEFNALHRAVSIENLITSADVVFGCTGKDITTGISRKILQLVTREITFISTSSEDKEFRELLQFIMSRLERTGVELAPLGDVHFRAEAGGRINIIAAGTPINFLVNSQLEQTWNVPAKDIAVTQGALFGSIIQAKLMATSNAHKALSAGIQLDANIQKAVAASWNTTAHNGKYPPDLLKKFMTEPGWIEKNSGGQAVESSTLERYFSKSLLAAQSTEATPPSFYKLS